MSVLLSPAYYMAFLSRNATLECKILQYDYTVVWTECNMKVVLHPLYSMRLALIGCCDVIYTFHHSYDECFKGFQDDNVMIKYTFHDTTLCCFVRFLISICEADSSYWCQQ